MANFTWEHCSGIRSSRQLIIVQELKNRVLTTWLWLTASALLARETNHIELACIFHSPTREREEKPTNEVIDDLRRRFSQKCGSASGVWRFRASEQAVFGAILNIPRHRR